MCSDVIFEDNPFHGVGLTFKTEPILCFRQNDKSASAYLNEVKGPDIERLMIGWVCDRDSFFAYLYKCMKKEAREESTTQMASQIAHAGFSKMLPDVNEWIERRSLPVLLVPVASRHGVSERFAKELHEMLGEPARRLAKVETMLHRVNKEIEIKKIKGWTDRNSSVEDLFSVSPTENLGAHSVLLVDDIVTSGASLRKSASMLRSCGANDIAAIVLATNLFDSY